MSSDSRWQGGAANRTWQQGTQPVGHVTDTDRLAADVALYLAECRAHPHLDPKYHPTEAGAIKLIYHASDDEPAIRALFQRLTSSPTAARAALRAVAGEGEHTQRTRKRP